MKKRPVNLLSVAALFLTSCSLSTNPSRDTLLTGIKITDVVTSVASSETEQVVSYQLSLYNGESVDILVHWIEPVLIEQVTERVLTTNNQVVVEKTVAPNSSLQIRGEFTFENKGATKVEIMSWNPLFTGFTLSSEMSLPIPGPEAK